MPDPVWRIVPDGSRRLIRGRGWWRRFFLSCVSLIYRIRLSPVGECMVSRVM